VAGRHAPAPNASSCSSRRWAISCSVAASTTPPGITAPPPAAASSQARKAGREASNHHNALIQRYRDEDRVAGRMEWPEYMIRRFKLGFDPL
jgi:hypothetical protein